mgnify:CR=1 FL=1
MRFLVLNKTMSANTIWPDGFMDIGGKSFKWVYEHKKVFVEFCLTEMNGPTGMFKEFQKYCYKMEIVNKQT